MDASGFRIGLGYDNHRLVAGRPLFLGGLEIPSEVGAEAHSDGDALIHAIVDAMLGALAQGDIGTHFSDRDPRWQGQASRLFLERTAEIVRDRGYRIVNIDSTIILENIRIGDRKHDIIERLRSILSPWFELPEGVISVKAKTNEGCDAVGQGDAVACQAVVLLARIEAEPQEKPDS